MNAFNKLLNMGGEVIGGVMYLNRKTVGTWSGGTFILYAEGEQLVNEQVLREAAAAAALEAEAAKSAAKAAVPPPAKPRGRPVAPPIADTQVAADAAASGGTDMEALAADLSALVAGDVKPE